MKKIFIIIKKIMSMLIRYNIKYKNIENNNKTE